VGTSDLTSPADSVRTYSLEENRKLTQNLLAITTRVHAREFADSPPTRELLRHFHASLFEGVRDHAGRVRGPGFGQEHLLFGPNRSCHRRDVERELEQVFRRAAAVFHELVADRDASNFEERAIWLAVETHAEVIRIHPFEDGNGRSSRLLMGQILVALGLRSIPVEACKQEYNHALNLYFERKTREPLLSLFLRLYPVAGDEGR